MMIMGIKGVTTLPTMDYVLKNLTRILDKVMQLSSTKASSEVL